MNYLRIFVLAFLLSQAGCHSGSSPLEEKEQLASGKAVSGINVGVIEAKIKAFIAENTQEDNSFHVEEKGRDLRLKFLRLHTEYLSRLGARQYFACADLVDQSGDVYDVDFFFQGDPEKLTVSKTSLHKHNGKPFYFWEQQQDQSWAKVAVEDASPALMGVVHEQDEFEFRYQVRLPEIRKEARMWVPIATSDRFQQVKQISLKAPGEQQILQEKENGNSILFLELGPENSGESLEIVYQVKRQERGPFEAPEPIAGNYLGASSLMPVGGRFSKIANEAIEGKRLEGKVVQARALYDYIVEHMQYIKTGNYGNGDAVFACDTRTGNCSEFHSFFISLARSIDIPARFAIGAAIPSERNEGGIGGYHCWAEFYAEGKWWPVDISEGNKFNGLASYYFGHQPANRLELSRGRDLSVEPAPHSGPINFLAYPLLEIGGEPTPTETSFSFSRKLK